MTITTGKRRYSVTLTPVNVKTFQAHCRQFGMPPGTLSAAIDDFIRDLNQVFDTAKAQGKFDLADIFRLMGKQVELFEEEERKNREAVR